MHSEKTTIRLAAVDMDGTLLHDDKSISDYTLDVLRKIVKKRCDPGTCLRKTHRRNERSSIK
ncbi:MAG: HAD family hydrolase [Clostridium sp.]